MKLHVSPGPGMEFQTQDETDVSGCQIGFSFLFSGPHLPFHPFLMSLTSSKRQVIGTKTLPVMKPGKMGGNPWKSPNGIGIEFISSWENHETEASKLIRGTSYHSIREAQVPGLRKGPWNP